MFGRSTWLSSLIVVASIAGGCGFDSATPAFGPGNQCAESSDCSQGLCDEGVCIDMSTNEVSVIVEVLRSPSDTQRVTPASWAFSPEAFTGMGTRNFSLPPTRTVEGNVRWKGDPVPATVRFTRVMAESVTALNAVPVEVGTTTGVEGTTGPDASDYQTDLVIGDTYEFVVVPAGDPIPDGESTAPAVRTLPPVYGSVFVAPEFTTLPLRLDVSFGEALEDECDAGEFVGCKLTGRILSFDGETASAAVGLQVRAVEKDSGRVVSSIGQTDESGDYAIRVSEQAQPYIVRVTSSAGAPEPFPSVSLDPEIAFAADPIERRVFVPRVDTVTFTGSVQDAAERPVQGASLRFASTGIFDQTALGFEGSFTASASTASDGKYTVQLLPGSYEIVVTPPENTSESWGPVSTQAIVVDGFPNSGETEPIKLASQVMLSGSCKTFNGDPAGGVTVAARARTEDGGLQRSQETVSAPTGEYSMNVDAGSYDLVIKLSDSTGFPWLVAPSFDIDLEDDPATRSWELPPPIVVRGLIRSAAGDSVPAAPIRAYVVAGFPPRAIQIAETTSADDGTYKLLISPTLDAQ